MPTGLITAGILTRKLGTSDYGLLTLSGTIVSWVEWSVASVLARASIKFVSETNDWRPIATALVRWHLILGIAAAIVVWLAAAPLERLLDEPGLTRLMQLMAFGIPIFSVAQAHRNMLAGRGEFKGRAASVAGRWLVRLGLILLFVGAGLNTSYAALAMIGATFAELLVCRRYIRPAFFGPIAPMHKLWAFAIPLFVAGLSLRVFEKLDLLALKALGGTSEQAGWYGAAQN
ncbi:MAG: oligosaccharide flippase family protein, partial [Schlesneria sp.]